MKRPIYTHIVNSCLQSLNSSVVERLDNTSPTESEMYCLAVVSENKQLVAITFFNKFTDLDKLVVTSRKHKEFTRKYNGIKFVNLGIEQKNIGPQKLIFEKYIENLHPSTDFNFTEWILNTDEEQIDSLLSCYY